MSARLTSLGVSITLLVAGAGAIVVACYEVPTPDCGFLCGPGDACPDGYTCADDHRCHRIGAPAGLTCPILDAPLPVLHDAAVDSRIDAPADAPTDTPVDAPVDVPLDAPMMAR
ncbi:MAG TPA: hypothetical protein VFT22_32255 [Kofleriaceae bacterium]|nr:hypothetical protein [Kofleriaceae bacterium]